MSLHFQTIGIMGKPGEAGAGETILSLVQHLEPLAVTVKVDRQVGEPLGLPEEMLCSFESLGKTCDLVIVVGGDGSMLKAARTLVFHDVPMLGINRGHLGFLTDVKPTEANEKVVAILQGHYSTEKRFLLHAKVMQGDDNIGDSHALNDVVLHPGAISHMLTFEVYIDGQFVYSQRSDGLIVATPTGSTAYSLSAGGPIMQPQLDVVVLAPMFPHTLTSRPIAIDSNSNIDIVISPENKHTPQLSCDGQVHIPVEPGGTINIRRKKTKLTMLHPEDYDYYEILRSKLGWGSKLF